MEKDGVAKSKPFVFYTDAGVTFCNMYNIWLKRINAASTHVLHIPFPSHF